MKVAICIPCHGDPKAEFTLSLARLMKSATLARIDTVVCMERDSILVRGRASLVAQARQEQATHILWADADHIFIPDALERLLRRNVDIVGCNYPRREPEAKPVAVATFGPIPVFTTKEKALAGEIEEVGSIGFGLCLIRMSVFDALEPPLFETTSRPDGRFVGEDVNFFAKVRKAGFKVWVDHAVSGGLGHLAGTTLTNDYSVMRNPELVQLGRRYATTVLPSTGTE